MITYKFKLYQTHRTKYLDEMLREACFVWNWGIAMHRRYYRLYHKHLDLYDLQKHFSKRHSVTLLHSQTVQEIFERIENGYNKFFHHENKRPPKFKKQGNYISVTFKKTGGYSLNGNVLTINKLKKRYKFSLSRDYNGAIKTLTLKRNALGEYFIFIVLDRDSETYGKTLKGASVGIDFGLKHYLTMSDGTIIENPQFLKENLSELRRLSRNLSKCKKDSNNRKRKLKELERLYDNICNKREDFQWKLAHELCRQYDQIFIEDLNIDGIGRRWGRKEHDLAQGFFVKKLFCVAAKYGVVVHKIDRYYPSSKTCTCGYINKDLKLSDRTWTCPECGEIHDRDLLAANNILRRGIYELESDSKTSKHSAKRLSRKHPRISSLQGWEYVKVFP